MANKQKAWRTAAREINQQEGRKHQGRKFKLGNELTRPVSTVLFATLFAAFRINNPSVDVTIDGYKKKEVTSEA